MLINIFLKAHDLRARSVRPSRILRKSRSPQLYLASPATKIRPFEDSGKMGNSPPGVRP